MTSTFQPCEECQGTNLQTQEYPMWYPPDKVVADDAPTTRRLCGICAPDHQQELVDTSNAWLDGVRGERVKRISEGVGRLLFDVLLGGFIVGTAGWFFGVQVGWWGWPL